MASPWPKNDSGDQTPAALDAVLTAAQLPVTGLALPSTKAALIAAASGAGQSLIAQVYTDAIHGAIGPVCAAIVTTAGGAPGEGSPDYAAFNAYAASYGMTPANFATLVHAMKGGLLTIGAAFGALQVAVAAASSAGDLAAPLATYESALSSVVTSINLASPPVVITTPPAISVKGMP